MAILGGLDAEGVSVKLDPPGVITFCDVPVEFTTPLQIYDVQPILWELYKLNFRFELVALDAWLTRASDKSLEARHHAIRHCFAGKSLLVLELQHAAWGLAARKWNYRLPYLMSLWRVMKTWVGCPVTMVEKDETGINIVRSSASLLLVSCAVKFAIG